MKKIVVILVSLFAFMMMANSVNAQLRTVGIQRTNDGKVRGLPAEPSNTGDPDDAKPNVIVKPANFKTPTVGELKQILLNVYTEKKDITDFEFFYNFSEYMYHGDENYSFEYIIYSIDSDNPDQYCLIQRRFESRKAPGKHREATWLDNVIDIKYFKEKITVTDELLAELFD